MDTAPSNQDLKAMLEAKLEPFVPHVVAAFGLVGLAIGIVKSGELVYSQGFGVRNLDTQEPVTAALALPAGLGLQDVCRYGHRPVGRARENGAGCAHRSRERRR